MHSPRGHRRFEWPDNDEILRRRYSVKARPAHHRVVLGPFAFFKGWLVSFGFWAALSLAVSIIVELSSPDSPYALGLWSVVLMFSFFIAVLIGAPFALVLGLLLRPVRRQWLHVLAFCTGFALLAFGIVVALIPGTAAMPAIFAVIVGLAAGLGRASIIRTVDIYGDSAVNADAQQP